MTLVSVTRLHVRSWRFFLPFLIYTMRSGSQAKRSQGFRGGMVGNDAQSGNWTITLWDSEEAMRSFRNSGAHRVAMPKLLRWCDEASFVHWEEADTAAPDADTAYQRLAREGKLSKVNAPSPRQQAGEKVGRLKPRVGQQLRAG